MIKYYPQNDIFLYSEPPLDPNVIYGHVGVFIGAGLAMGFNFRRKPAALIHVVQLFYLAYTIQTNAKLHYKDWLRVKCIVIKISTFNVSFKCLCREVNMKFMITQFMIGRWLTIQKQNSFHKGLYYQI
jgi:hypothetical protein